MEQNKELYRVKYRPSKSVILRQFCCAKGLKKVAKGKPSDDEESEREEEPEEEDPEEEEEEEADFIPLGYKRPQQSRGDL